MPSLEKSHRSEISGQKALCVSICYACHPENVQHVSKHKIWRKKQKKKTAERERTAWCPPNLTHKNASETTKRPCISSVKICLSVAASTRLLVVRTNGLRNPSTYAPLLRPKISWQFGLILMYQRSLYYGSDWYTIALHLFVSKGPINRSSWCSHIMIS